MEQKPRLILASTSVYRRELLSRLHVAFTVQTSNFDERKHELTLKNSTPSERAIELAYMKALMVQQENNTNNTNNVSNNSVIIGSDQYAYVMETHQALHKPETIANNIRQLQELSGKKVCFETAIAILYHDKIWQKSVPTVIQFRTLSDLEIENYVALEPAIDCVGGAKIEGLGISLVDTIISDDPTAIIGLPLIAVHQILREVGF